VPTYEIAAPNGKKYRISGPAGATDKQIRAQVLKQFPDAGIPSRSLLEAGLEAIPSAPASAVQFGKAFGEAITNPVETAGSMLDIAAGGLQKAAGAALPKPVMDFLNSFDDAAAKRAMDAANQFGGQMAYRYGSWDRIKNTLATDPVGFAADMSTLLSGGAGAAGRVGGVARKAQNAARADAIAGSRTAATTSRGARNVARGAEYVADKMSRAAELTNPVNWLAPVGRATRKIATKAPSVVADYLSPKSAAYMAAAEGRGNELVNAMRNPDVTIVPGTKPTAAQAASPVGATKFSAMGAQAEKILPTEYLARAGDNEAARLRSLRTVGGTPENIAALNEGRGLTGKQNYGAIERNVVAVDDTFRALTQRPSMETAMKRASEISAEQGVPFQMGRDVRPGSMAGMATEGRPAQYTVQSLHNMKTALDDIIKDPATFGVGANEARLMGNTRRQLVNWIESKAPGYKSARETFAKQSRRINQAEVGQFLEGKLTSALDTEAPQRANVFGAAVKEAPATIKNATTGASRYKQLTDLLEPHQVKVVEDIRKDLAREAETKLQATKAGTSEPRIKELASNTALPSPNLLSRVVTLANEIRKRVSGAIDRKLAIEIAAEMLDPKAAASALEKAMVRDFMAKETGRVAGKAAGAAGKALSSTPAKVGAQTQNIMTQAENRNAMNQQYNGSWVWNPNTQSAVWEPF
jgi:hypothetical protein